MDKKLPHICKEKRYIAVHSNIVRSRLKKVSVSVEFSVSVLKILILLSNPHVNTQSLQQHLNTAHTHISLLIAYLLIVTQQLSVFTRTWLFINAPIIDLTFYNLFIFITSYSVPLRKLYSEQVILSVIMLNVAMYGLPKYIFNG